jgi:Tfp pilus assembly protein PilF
LLYRLLSSLELEPDNAIFNGNYAQFLFIKGEESQAQVYLDKAFNFADNHQDLLAELWFYRILGHLELDKKD